MPRVIGAIALVIAAVSLVAASAAGILDSGSSHADARAEVAGHPQATVPIESRDGSAAAELPAGWHVGRGQVTEISLFTFTTYPRPAEPRDPGFCSGEPIPAGQVLVRVWDLPVSKKARRSYPVRPAAFRFPRSVRRGRNLIYDFTFRDHGRAINLWVWANLGRRGGREETARDGRRRKVTVRPGLRHQIESLFNSLEFRSPASHPAKVPSLSCRWTAGRGSAASGGKFRQPPDDLGTLFGLS